MANLRDYGQNKLLGVATNNSVGLVKGSSDVNIAQDGSIEIPYFYNGPFKLQLVSNTSVSVGRGRWHDGYGSQHSISVISGTTLTITENQTSAIWAVLQQSGTFAYSITSSETTAPTITGEGYCILIGIVRFSDGVASIEQCHYGDIVFEGVWY